MRRRHCFALLLAIVTLPALALYDPQPDSSLEAVEGSWRGTLQYRDYQPPNEMVTLPTKLYVALGSPNELVLHYVFDDGPGKVVHSYEKMQIDTSKKHLRWTSGSQQIRHFDAAIASDTVNNGVRQLVFEHRDGKVLDRYNVSFDATALTLRKEEIDAKGKATLRNVFTFSR